MTNESRNDKISVLLAEYQAAHMNRDHYDSMRWTIGSIFIASSLTLLGISFLEPVAHYHLQVLAITSFSCALFFVWLAYSQHVEPWVKASLKRLYEIEEELKVLGFDMRLHHSIREKRQIRGRWIRNFLIILVLSSCIVRLLLMIIPMR
ncbi:MAG: hypothetical protein QXP38_04320 [Nitrososphaerota archaeon]